MVAAVAVSIVIHVIAVRLPMVTLQGSVSEFFQVSLSTGQLYLEMHGIADVGFGSFVRFTRGRYNDGKVHQFVMKHDIVTVGDQEIGRLVTEQCLVYGLLNANTRLFHNTRGIVLLVVCILLLTAVYFMPVSCLTCVYYCPFLFPLFAHGPDGILLGIS